jgi:hypothetical protein
MAGPGGGPFAPVVGTIVEVVAASEVLVVFVDELVVLAVLDAVVVVGAVCFLSLEHAPSASPTTRTTKSRRIGAIVRALVSCIGCPGSSTWRKRM